ncbi:MAG: hypothetical protein QM765_46670 [Myxococcales bacterium]
MYVRIPLDELRDSTRDHAVALAGVLAASAVVALVLARRMGRLVRDPVLSLAGVAADVTARSDYSVRAAKAGDDEVGRLTDCFNGMLARVQARDDVFADTASTSRTRSGAVRIYRVSRSTLAIRN